MRDGPVPADPGRDEPRPDWEPVITCPDPMTAEEWQTQLECEPVEGTDPEEYPDEEDYLSPEALNLTDAELAEIAEATRFAALAAGQATGPGDEADPAGVADVLAAQAAAASARRRGPGQPGSARRRAGESSSRAAAFGTGLCLDVMPAGPDLALLADAAAGPGDSYAGASDDELIGVLCAWDRSESHAHARKLAAITELRRRRPATELPASGRGAGARDEDYLADEIAHALAESRRAADGLAAVAGALDGKLPGTRAALLDGVITPVKARIIATATAPLDQDEARAAEEQVLGRAGRITPGSLREAIRRAVMNVAPAKAKERREAAARDARVEQWAEDSGNAALAGRELPPAEVIAAGQRITWWARQLRAAGVDGDLDQLRGRAYLDLLLGRDSRPGTTAGPVPGETGGFAANVNLTVPLTTAQGLADRPGELSGFGSVDPWLARDLARAAAANPKPPGASPSPTPTGTPPPTAAPGQHPRATANTGNGTAPDHPAGPGNPTDRDSRSLLAAATGRPAVTAPGSCAPPDQARP